LFDDGAKPAHNKERVSPDRTDVTVNVEARISETERLATILHLCRALTGVAITGNELLGFTTVREGPAAMVDALEQNGGQDRLDRDRDRNNDNGTGGIEPPNGGIKIRVCSTVPVNILLDPQTT
jgi:hypothetical protein